MWPASSSAGLKPAGTDGYFQPVRLISREIDEAHSSLTLVRRSGQEEPLVLGQDAILSSRVEPAPASRPRWSSPGMG